VSAKATDSPRIFTIEPGDAFLPCLARALARGELIDGFSETLGPLGFSAATIFVPTRRAARALRLAFAARSAAAGSLLPDIRPLGEFEDDVLDLAAFGAAEEPGLPLPVGVHERLFALAPLVQAWRARLPAHIAARFGADDPVMLPASAADALRMARALADLIDETARDEADWSALDSLDEQREIADWWRLTADFLAIIRDAWPEALRAMNRSNPAAFASAQIDAARLALEAGPPDRVVIAAGSTGSIPATARLLSSIARLPRGAVVLPGFDTRLSAGTLAALREPDTDATLPGHPQFGMVQLLNRMKADPGAVISLSTELPASLTARRRLISDALLPARDTSKWAGGGPEPGALLGIGLIEAGNEREEALAIATAMRGALETRDETVALVTPDRALARRVAVELHRFGVLADDSGGVALADTKAGSFLLCAADAFLGAGDAVALLSLLKHPLFRLGRPRADMRALAEAFELYALRGRKGRLNVRNLAGELAAAEAFHNDPGNRASRSRVTPPSLMSKMAAFAAAFDDAAATLAALDGERALSVWLGALILFCEHATVDEQGDLSPFLGGDEGEALSRWLSGIIAAASEFAVTASDIPPVLAALISGETVKPRPGGHPRAFIWGTLEARLQSVDTMILGGLNEGVFPALPDPGPFVSRGMRQAIGLVPPERRLGQAAHDFEQAMGCRTVMLSRALKADGAPAEPARWLQRLEAVAGDDGMRMLRDAGNAILSRARRLDVADTPMEPAARPQPRPPLHMRPKDFSVTEIDTLRRDPYAIYARHILKLEPLPELVRDPDARERGTLFHAILDDVVRSGLDFAANDAEAQIIAIAKARFDAAALEPDIVALWWPRFTALIPSLVADEAERQHSVEARLPELRSAKLGVSAHGETLRARADRLDLMSDGGAVLSDYKTGSTPTPAHARNLRSSQLALEAALLLNGAFGEAKGRGLTEISIIRLGAKGQYSRDIVAPGQSKGAAPVTPDGLAELALDKLDRLMRHYHDETTPYVSRADPLTNLQYEPVYDHLARVAEWSASGGESFGGDGPEDDAAAGDGEGGDGGAS
jgi:ATP-dependent helicase/nuclease subunit B